MKAEKQFEEVTTSGPFGGWQISIGWCGNQLYPLVLSSSPSTSPAPSPSRRGLGSRCDPGPARAPHCARGPRLPASDSACLFPRLRADPRVLFLAYDQRIQRLAPREPLPSRYFIDVIPLEYTAPDLKGESVALSSVPQRRFLRLRLLLWRLATTMATD